MEHQNWDYTYIEKKTNNKGEKATKQALHQGLAVEHVKKNVTNNPSNLDGRYVAKVLNEDEYKVQTVSHDFRIALQQARQAKGWTQEQLAKACCEKKSVISDYESGRAIPHPSTISKFESALGCKLPRDKKKK
ncbi:hypothetical protein ABPG74_003326 [Tetrahymena malaccensis]